MRVGVFDLDRDDVANREMAGVAQMDLAVDLGRVGLRSAGRAAAFRVHRVDDDVERAADLGVQLGGGDSRGELHQAGVALFLDFLRHRIGQGVRRRALDRLETERADAVQLRFLQPVHQIGEIVLRLAGEADDEGRSHGNVRANLAPALDAFEHLRFVGRATHRLEHRSAGVLEGNVEIGEHQPLGHQRDDLIDMGVGIDIVEPNPGRDLAELARQIGHVRADFAAVPHPREMLDIDAIGRCVLADHQQFPGAGLDQLFRLAQDRIGPSADEVAA